MSIYGDYLHFDQFVSFWELPFLRISSSMLNYVEKGRINIKSTSNEEKLGQGGCLEKSRNFDQKSMRDGDVSRGLNEAKVL